MKKSKLKTILIILITIVLCLSVGVYAGYTLSAQEVTYTKPDGTTVTVKEALDDLKAKMTTGIVPATSITEAQSNDMFAKIVNSTILDAYGNKIVVPAGFKIKVDDTTKNATTVDKGIVIVDRNENEFVWIPTGKIYTDVDRTEEKAKTIELNRYEFDGSGNPTAKGDAAIVTWDENVTLQELATSTLGNTTAKNIAEFKIKASQAGSGGFYIGRYEARTGTARSVAANELTTLTTKASDYIYNYVTQPQAAELARNMYQNATTYTSDLINSYAWDTATLFLQTFGDNTTYSRQNSLNTTLATTGTNDTANYTGTQDVQCNVYDMASNTLEWETETSSYSGNPCAFRGGNYYDAISNYTSQRNYPTTSGSDVNAGFRPLLYL